MTEFKKPTDSDVVISTVMEPEDSNVGGNVFGGKILALMDHAAYAAACRHARNSTVTAAVDAVNFRTPIHVGDLVTLKARVNYAGKSSMTVGIRVETENLITGEIRHSNSSYFTMVAVGDDGKSRPVPGIIIENINDFRRYVRAAQNRRQQALHHSDFNAKEFVVTQELLDWANNQNVQLHENIGKLVK